MDQRITLEEIYVKMIHAGETVQTLTNYYPEMIIILETTTMHIDMALLMIIHQDRSQSKKENSLVFRNLNNHLKQSIRSDLLIPNKSFKIKIL